MKKILLVDFDGVMSQGKFYQTNDLVKQYLTTLAQQALFTSENTPFIHDWMRGRLSYEEVNDYVARKINVSFSEVEALLLDSVKQFSLNQRMLDFVKILRNDDWIVCLFTDNMDVFDRVTRPYFGLDDHFDGVYSSSEQGVLKLENETMLTTIRSDFMLGDDTELRLVDDNPHKNATVYGLNVFHYVHHENSQNAFEKWCV